MTGMEIALLILGVIIFVASFIVPETMKDFDDETVKLSDEKIKELVDIQVKDAKEQIKDAVDETVSYAVEKSERSLERITNEKITAVSEFSETVLTDINKNHQEVMFMYDMLHDKQKNLRETAMQVDKTNAMAKETKSELENVTRQLMEEVVPEIPTAVAEPEFPSFNEPEFPSFAEVKEPEEQKNGEDFMDLMDIIKSEPKKKEKTTKTKKTKVIEPTSIPVVAGVESESNNNNDRILELHKQGKSNIAIAKELGLGVGEVNLVIDLFEVM